MRQKRELLLYKPLNSLLYGLSFDAFRCKNSFYHSGQTACIAQRKIKKTPPLCSNLRQSFFQNHPHQSFCEKYPFESPCNNVV